MKRHVQIVGNGLYKSTIGIALPNKRLTFIEELGSARHLPDAEEWSSRLAAVVCLGGIYADMPFSGPIRHRNPCSPSGTKQMTRSRASSHDAMDLCGPISEMKASEWHAATSSCL